MNKIMLLVLIFVICQGCEVSHCIKLEGGSDKYGIDNASVEYCFDGRRSEEEKAAVLINNNEEYFVVHRKYIDQANERLTKGKIQSSSAKTSMENFVHLLEKEK